MTRSRRNVNSLVITVGYIDTDGIDKDFESAASASVSILIQFSTVYPSSEALDDRGRHDGQPSLPTPPWDLLQQLRTEASINLILVSRVTISLKRSNEGAQPRREDDQ